MQYGKRWTDFTYLFKTRKPDPRGDLERITPPNPLKAERRRRIEEHMERRALGRELADVWE